MAYQIEKLEKLAGLVEQHAPQDGVNLTSLPNFAAFKVSTTRAKTPAIDVPALVIVAQGRKNCYVGDRVFDYSPGNALIMFYPMAVEVELFEASPGKPFLAACVGIDLGRLAEVLLRIERVDGGAAKAHSPDPSGVFSAPLNDHLLDPTIRLFESLADPTDAAILFGGVDRGRDLLSHPAR